MLDLTFPLCYFFYDLHSENHLLSSDSNAVAHSGLLDPFILWHPLSEPADRLFPFLTNAPHSSWPLSRNNISSCVRSFVFLFPAYRRKGGWTRFS